MKLIKKITLMASVLATFSILSCGFGNHDDNDESSTSQNVSIVKNVESRQIETLETSNEQIAKSLFNGKNWISSENSYWKIDLSKQYIFYTEDEYNRIVDNFNKNPPLAYEENGVKYFSTYLKDEILSDINLEKHGYFKEVGSNTEWFYKYEKKSDEEIILSYRIPSIYPESDADFSIKLTPVE